MIGTLASAMICFRVFYFVCKSFCSRPFYEWELYVSPKKNFTPSLHNLGFLRSKNLHIILLKMEPSGTPTNKEWGNIWYKDTLLLQASGLYLRLTPCENFGKRFMKCENYKVSRKYWSFSIYILGKNILYPTEVSHICVLAPNV